MEVNVVLILLGVAYFLPFVIAVCMRHKQWLGILALNLLLGWTLLFWLLAIVWAFCPPRSSRITTVQQQPPALPSMRAVTPPPVQSDENWLADFQQSHKRRGRK